QNKHGDVRLETLRISKWNGVPPQSVVGEHSALRRTDGSLTQGRIVGFDSKTKQFTVREGDETVQVAAEEVSDVLLTPEEDDSTAENEAEDGRAVRLTYYHAQVSGRPVRIDNDSITLESPAFAKPLTLPLKRLRSLF